MHRSFRMEPPEPRPDVLVRPRLLRALLGRWHHRATVVVGGPGLGKTTLLAQAVDENRLAPRGHDVWIGLEPHDADDGVLARTVATALGRSDESSTDAASVPLDATSVADAVWRRAPAELCLVFDDVHLLPEGSHGARWLARLLDALPANGHVVLASRTEPSVPLARLRGQGDVLDLGESDLRFTGAELDQLADRRGVDPGRFDETGGWPALAELASHVDARRTGSYLWEEVLAPLSDERRQLLAVLCDLGGADEALLSAALDTDVELPAALDGVPLIAADARGWYVPHALWHSVAGLALGPDEQAAVRRRAVVQLTDRGHFDTAFRLLSQAGLWDLAPAMLRAACLSSDRLTSRRLDGWLAQCPEDVRTSPAGCLAVGLHRTFVSPGEATEPLRVAVDRCREAGDVDCELVAIAQLGLLAWWRQDIKALGPDLAIRMGELSMTGHPLALALTALGCAMAADVNGEDETVLFLLGTIQPDVLDQAWAAMGGWLEGTTRLDLGDAHTALAIVDRFTATLTDADPVLQTILDALRLHALWAQGRIEQVVAGIPEGLNAAQRAGVAYNQYVGMTMASIVFSYLGDARTASEHLDGGLAVAPRRRSVDVVPAPIAMATASLRLAEGDEAEAARVLRAALDAHGLDRGVNRHVWRQTLSLGYILLPETRAHWDARPLRGHLQVGRDLAAAVVAAREGHGTGRLATHNLDVPDIDVVRTALHHRHAAELAVHLHAAGRSEGPALLEALGSPGRVAVRALAAGSRASRSAGSPKARPSGAAAKPAKALLAALPAPPPRTTCIAALGELTLRRDAYHGEEVTDPNLRRRRVRELLAFLLGHRSTTRTALMDALWPDLDPEVSSNNLAVTLTYLLRVLEPWRTAGEPAYLLRMEGQGVRLVTDDHLRVDIDEFARHVAAAAAAETDGAPSVALGHHLAAVALYRGPLCADLPEAGWITLDREHYATRFVSAASRAAQLLLGRGDVEQAEDLARQALVADPWAEAAHAALVGAALSRGDRSAARRRLDRCLEGLAHIGVEPTDTTRRLERRVRHGEPESGDGTGTGSLGGSASETEPGARAMTGVTASPPRTG